MTIRVTFEMSSERSTWSESHYYLNASLPDFHSTGGALTALGQAAKDLGQARAGLLGINAQLDRARSSVPGGNRLVDYLDFGQASGTWPTPGKQGKWTADQPNAAIVTNARTLIGRTFRTYLAGIPDAVIQTVSGVVGTLDPPPEFITPWLIYQGILTGGLWAAGIKSNPVSQPIVGLTQNAQFPSLIGVGMGLPLPGVDVGTRVQIRGMRRTNMAGKDLNGIWVVGGTIPAPPAGATVYFLRDSAGVDPTNFWRMGAMATLGVIYDPYVSINYDFGGTRKRGGSIGLPRGRLKSRRSRGF